MSCFSARAGGDEMLLSDGALGRAQFMLIRLIDTEYNSSEGKG